MQYFKLAHEINCTILSQRIKKNILFIFEETIISIEDEIRLMVKYI